MLMYIPFKVLVFRCHTHKLHPYTEAIPMIGNAVVHPEYSPGQSLRNDFAVITLERASFAPVVAVDLTPEYGEDAATQPDVTTMGWGRLTEVGSTEYFPFSGDGVHA